MAAKKESKNKRITAPVVKPVKKAKKPGTSRSLQEKKELAKILFTRNDLSRKEVAQRVGVNEKTMGKWVADEMWDNLRKSLLTSKEDQLHFFYDQLDCLNRAIAARAEGKRYADSKEADIVKKLTASIKDLEVETGIDTIVDVAKEFINWVRPDDLDEAKKITKLFDSFIKWRLKRK